MSIEKLKATGNFVFIIRDEAKKESGGLVIPDLSQKKPNTGIILSVGGRVEDSNIVAGNKAIFNKSVGSTIDIFDTEITVLNGNEQILGVEICK